MLSAIASNSFGRVSNAYLSNIYVLLLPGLRSLLNIRCFNYLPTQLFLSPYRTVFNATRNIRKKNAIFLSPSVCPNWWVTVGGRSKLNSAWDDEEGEACDGASPLLSGTATVMAFLLLLHWHTSATAEARNG